MGTVRIAHLSDLHFVPGKEDAKVWEQVRDFINHTVKPHAVLITGDVTDSATQAEFELAQQSLGSLALQPGGDGQKYRIVAGNHDRYLYRGNGPPLSRAWVSRRWWPRDKQARFDHAFSGAVHVTPTSPCNMTLRDAQAPDDPPWKVRVIGLDSSASTQWFAQGAVRGTDIHSACKGATEDPEARELDLVIALVHHHVLPIPAVEQKRMDGDGLLRLMDATGMLNSGSLLAALSRSQVDLVLHGHEHSAHQARFAGADELATDVAVLGAGSATGDETLKGWNLQRVHFNVIELDDDRSVWLRQVSCQNGQLGFEPGRRQILAAKDIRVSRFVRRNRGLEPERASTRKLPASRLRKLVDFRGNRDIELAETRTDWQVNTSWRFSTQSGSGTVDDALIRFDWVDGAAETFQVPATAASGTPDQFLYHFELPNMHRPRMAKRVTTRWKWAGAAVFTQTELDMLPPSAKAGPRKQHCEFASVLCSGEYEELVLSLRLPPRFAPDPASMRVYYEKDDAPGKQVYSNEFLGGLDTCGPGNFDLRIAYPMPHYRYGLSWPLPEVDTVSPAQASFGPGLLLQRAAIEQAMARWLAAQGWGSLRWGIYTHASLGDGSMRLLWGDAHAGPERLLMHDARCLARAALWGDSVVARADENNQRYEFLSDEQLLAYVSLRQTRELSFQALAILRIGFTSDPIGPQADKLKPWMQGFRSFSRMAGMVISAAALGQALLL